MASSWNAIFAPKNLSLDVQAKLNAAVVKALDGEATRRRLLDLGCVIPDKADRTSQALQELERSGALVISAPGRRSVCQLKRL